MSRRWERLRTADRGAETVEFAIVLPLLLLLAFGSLPLLQFIGTHRDLSRLADEAAVYSTRVDNNPSPTTDNAVCGSVTRRRSFADVRNFSVAGQPGVTGVDVYVQPAGAMTPDMSAPSSQNPCTAPASSRIHIQITSTYSTGPLAAAANAIGRLLGSAGDIVPSNPTVRAVSAAYLE